MDMTNKWKSYFIQLLTFKQMHESMNWYVHDRMHVYVPFGVSIVIQQLNKEVPLIKR